MDNETKMLIGAFIFLLLCTLYYYGFKAEGKEPKYFEVLKWLKNAFILQVVGIVGIWLCAKDWNFSLMGSSNVSKVEIVLWIIFVLTYIISLLLLALAPILFLIICFGVKINKKINNKEEKQDNIKNNIDKEIKDNSKELESITLNGEVNEEDKRNSNNSI